MNEQQHFINHPDLSQVIRFLENVSSSYADNGTGSVIRGKPLGFTLQPWGVTVTRQAYDGRSIESFTFKVVKL